MNTNNPDKLSPETVAYIKALQNKVVQLESKVEQQDIRISNLTEMLVVAHTRTDVCRGYLPNCQRQAIDSQLRMWVFCSGMHSNHKMALNYHHATRSGKVVKDLIGDYQG